ncbi:5153_t:CDS:1, partial [Gigaspora rosea]
EPYTTYNNSPINMPLSSNNNFTNSSLASGLPDISSTTSLISNNHSTLKLNIATHYVQGYNNPTKKQLWEEYFLENSLHIISITETKISSSKSKQFFNTLQFTYF